MNEIEKKLWKRVRFFSKFFKMIPFLKMAAVCNNLAFGKVSENSDIDLFIVAKTGRLFTVRTFVTFWFSVFGVRRHANKVAGRFCLSFFIDEEAMDLSPLAIPKDFYLAYWVGTIVPIVDINNTSLKFLSRNKWIEDYFEEKIVPIDFKIESNGFGFTVRRFLEFILKDKFGNFAEMILRRWQVHRARKKASKVSKENPEASILITEHVLKFHNVDRRKKYKEKWCSIYGSESKLTRNRFLAIISE